jgi:hypothetical protein
VTAWLFKQAKVIAALVTVAFVGMALWTKTDQVLNVVTAGAVGGWHGAEAFFGLLGRIIHHFFQ